MSKMTDEMRLELVEKIKTAFADTPYPTDGPIVDEHEEDFKGKHWSEISTEALRFQKDELVVFSPAAFRYFLPAFLIAVILQPDEVDTLVDNIIYYLYPAGEDDPIRAERFNYRMPVFSLLEKQAIKSFIVAYMDLVPYAGWSFDPNAEEVLAKAIDYWLAQTNDEPPTTID